MTEYPEQGLQLSSTIASDGKLYISVDYAEVRSPRQDEVVIRIDAAPINPTDVRLLLGAADVKTLTRLSDNTLSARFPKEALPGFKARLDKPISVGNEASGLVVGAGLNTKGLIGKNVAIWGGKMYRQYRTIKATETMVLPEDVSAAQGASAFINPLTVLGMMETAQQGGHRAIVHTAAASNVGQMLNRLCLKKGISLVNIVRSETQVELLKAAGAQHVLNSRAKDFETLLQDSLRETEARLAFDAIGGPMPGKLLTSMEQSQMMGNDAYSQYGSPITKQVYVYGVLDAGPIILPRAMGSAWSVGGWLLFHFLDKIGPTVFEELKEQVSHELNGIFSSHYDTIISLTDMLAPDVIKGFYARSTGKKYLIAPQQV